VARRRVSKRCFNGGQEDHSEACMCYLLLLHCDTGVAPSAGPKRRLMLDMRGAADAGGCYFRKGGKGRRVPSAAVAAGLCLLPVAGAVDGAVIVRELRNEGKRD